MYCIVKHSFLLPIHCHATTIIPSLIPPWLLVNQRSSIKRHSLHIRLGGHRLALIAHLAQQLEIVNIKRWRRSEEQFRFLIRRVGERVWRADGNGHVIADVSVDDFLVLARVLGVGDVEADGSLGDVESLIVHFVPVRWWTGGFGWEGQFDRTQAVVWERDYKDGDSWRPGLWYIPVREPSSRMRQVIWPR